MSNYQAFSEGYRVVSASGRDGSVKEYLRRDEAFRHFGGMLDEYGKACPAHDFAGSLRAWSRQASRSKLTSGKMITSSHRRDLN